MQQTYYDTSVRPCLQEIEWFADRAVKAVESLPLRPNFLTKAEHSLMEAHGALLDALMKIETAREKFDATPVE